MKREFIKELLPDISKEALDAIMAENGKDIEKYKGEASEAKTSAEQLKSQLTDRDTQLEELKKVDAAGLQAKITELQTANTDAQKKHEADLKAAKLEFALETHLVKEGAVNTKAVRALLDATKISLDGENLVGLDEQLKALKGKETWAFAQQQTPAQQQTYGGFTPPAGMTGKQGEPKSLDEAVTQFYQQHKGEI